jgi:transposase InsO family protein
VGPSSSQSSQDDTPLVIEDLKEGKISGKPFVDLQIGCTSVPTLVDTGAQISVMSERKFKELSKCHKCSNFKNISWGSDVSVTSASGHDLQNLGSVDVTFKIKTAFDDRKIRHSCTFKIIRGLQRDMILGSDFLQQNQAVIDYHKYTIRIRSETYPLTTDDGPARLYTLVTQQRTTLPPGQSTMIPCLAPLDTPAGTYLAQFLDNAPVIEKTPGVSLANCLIQINEEKELTLLAVNETPCPLTLPKSAAIAILEEVESDTIEELSSVEQEPDKQPAKAELNGEQLSRLNGLIENFSGIFAESDLDLGSTNVIQYNIDTGDHPPIKQRAYRIPHLQKPVVEEHLKNMLNAKVIQPSTSPWAAPIVMVPKKDGTKRMCVDFRKINQVTVPNSYPLPQIDDILSSLGGAKFFSKMDLKSGYWQVNLHPDAKPKTAFITHMGLFEFNKLPFGLCNAPSQFQDLMNTVLQGLLYVNVLCYLDDIIVYSKTFEDHLEHLESVFTRLSVAGLKLKLSKCEFFMKQLHFLGHLVSSEGLQPDLEKVTAILNLPAPTDVSGVRSFLGMCGYYRRFIPQFSAVSAPLVSLTKKDTPFVWTDACESAFKELRTRLSSSPVLIHPNIRKPYKLYTDASDKTIGAILTQDDANGEEHVIEYYSCQLKKAQRNWATIEKEAYAIVAALRKFRQYLLDADFTVFTDHRPLQNFFKGDHQNARIQRWSIKVSEYKCKIQYLPGKIQRADFLSRISDVDSQTPSGPVQEPQEADIVELSAPAPIDPCVSPSPEEPNQGPDPPIGLPFMIEESCANDLPDTSEALRRIQATDPDFKDIYSALKDNPDNDDFPDYTVDDGILYKVAAPIKNDSNWRLLIALPRLLVLGVLSLLHDQHGHLGTDKTYDLIRQRYFWHGCYRDVCNYIKKCLTCCQRRPRATRVPMQSMDIPDRPMEVVSIDLQGPFPESAKGNRYIATIVCQMSGWPEAFAIPDKRADTVANVLLSHFLPTHSVPEVLISDNGTEFCNEVLDYLAKKMGIKRIRTSPYHPEANGRCERLHRTLNDIIAKRVSKNQLDWEDHIPAALWAIRTSTHSGSRHTPYFLVYGREPRLPIDLVLRPKYKYVGEAYVPTMLQRLHQAYQDVKRNLRESQERNMRYKNEGVTLPEFEIGDKVLYKNFRLDPGLSSKFQGHWQTHFRVLEKTTPVNYVITHLPTNTTKRVHASQLLAVPCDVEWDKEFDQPDEFVSTEESSRLRNLAQEEADDGKEKRFVRRNPVRGCRLVTPTTTPVPDPIPQRVSPLVVPATKRKVDESEEDLTMPKRVRIYEVETQDWTKRVVANVDRFLLLFGMRPLFT